MNNQLFHITNHWVLEKKPQGSSLLWWQFWHKPIFAGKKYFCLSNTDPVSKQRRLTVTQTNSNHNQCGASNSQRKTAYPQD